eukprot:SAG31_NODE_1075_length_10048_cov_21.627701_11_plen_87_part_00
MLRYATLCRRDRILLVSDRYILLWSVGVCILWDGDLELLCEAKAVYTHTHVLKVLHTNSVDCAGQNRYPMAGCVFLKCEDVRSTMV